MLGQKAQNDGSVSGKNKNRWGISLARISQPMIFLVIPPPYLGGFLAMEWVIAAVKVNQSVVLSVRQHSDNFTN